VNRSTAKRGGAGSSAMFLGTSLVTLLRYTSRTARIDIDGMLVERDVRSIVIANGRYFGGGMHVAPNAVLDDGQFDVVIIGETGRTRALTGISSLYRGRHLSRREVEVYRARTVRVTCDGEPMLFDVEGEQVGATPATLTCLPDAIALCVPAAGGGRPSSISC
jgi:diacylglycerol kinase (ATP)